MKSVRKPICKMKLVLVAGAQQFKVTNLKTPETNQDELFNRQLILQFASYNFACMFEICDIMLASC